MNKQIHFAYTYHEIANFLFVQLTQPLRVEKLKIMPGGQRRKSYQWVYNRGAKKIWKFRSLQLGHPRNTRLFWFSRTTLTHCLLKVLRLWVATSEKPQKKKTRIPCHKNKILNQNGCVECKGKCLLSLPLPFRWFNPVLTNNFFNIKSVLVLYTKGNWHANVSWLDKGEGDRRLSTEQQKVVKVKTKCHLYLLIIKII